MNIKDRYDNAIRNLFRGNKYLAAEITKLGYPRLSDCPTAQVSWDDKKRRPVFEFGKEFYNKISDEQFDFIISHEAGHLYNGHIFFLGDEIKRLKNFNISNKEIYRYKLKMNVAMDCVINDTMVNCYGFSKESVAKLGLCFGKEVVGLDCEDMTAEEVFCLIPDEKADQFGDGDILHNWDSFFDDSGNLKKEFVDKIKDFVSRNQSNSNMSDQEFSVMDKLKDSFEKSKDPNMAGNVPGNNLRPISESDHCLRWDYVISQFVETRKVQDSWDRPSRKLSAVYPDVLLPRQKDQEAQEIFVAIDSSGSIDMNALGMFVDIAKNTPDHIKIQAVSFDTKCYPFDVCGTSKPQGGGGTRFDIIEEYIQKNLKKYPKCVIVLTDGAGGPVNPAYPRRWLWLLYGCSNSSYCQDMKHYDIYKLMKK